MNITETMKTTIRGTVNIDSREGNDGVDEAVEAITEEMVSSGMFHRELFGYAVRHEAVDSWQLITDDETIAKIESGLILTEDNGFITKALYTD